MITSSWITACCQKLVAFRSSLRKNRYSAARRKRGLVSLAAESLESRAMLSAAYAQTNLVSDGFVPALQTDPNLVNPWGIAAAPGGAFWLSDNGTGVSTLYSGSGNVIPAVFIVPNRVGHAGPSTPTGIVYNATSDFAVTGGPSNFIFATEDGTISGWANTASAELKVDRSASGAVYKGLATGSVGANNFLYATNFHSGKIEVFDKSFTLVTPTGNFTLPATRKRSAPRAGIMSHWIRACDLTRRWLSICLSGERGFKPATMLRLCVRQDSR